MGSGIVLIHEDATSTTPGSTMAALSTVLASKSSVPYDVLMTDSLSLYAALDAGLLDEVSASSIPNIADLYPQLIEGQSDGHIYAVPMLISNMILAYRRDDIAKPNSLKELADPKYAGKVGLFSFENSGGVMTLVALANANGGSVENIGPGFTEMKKIMSNVVATTPSTVGLVQLLERGEISVAPLWNGRTMELIDRGLPIDFSVQSEGLYTVLNHFGVVKESKVKDAAHVFIDKVISPEVGAAIATKLYYGTANRKLSLPPDVAKKMVAYGEKSIASLKIPDWKIINKLRATWMARWNSELSR